MSYGRVVLRRVILRSLTNDVYVAVVYNETSILMKFTPQRNYTKAVYKGSALRTFT